MTQISILVLWTVSGLASAAALPDSEASRFGWAPVSLFFGPLWLFVAVERRQVAEQDQHGWSPSVNVSTHDHVELA
jgi:hypothetical protein